MIAKSGRNEIKHIASVHRVVGVEGIFSTRTINLTTAKIIMIMTEITKAAFVLGRYFIE
jgi:hypothetical protein